LSDVWLNKMIRNLILIFIKSVEYGTVLTKLILFTELPPHILLSQVAISTDLRTFL
jgi:hypothetical protein